MRVGVDIDDVLYPWYDLAHEASQRAGITGGVTPTRWAPYEEYGCTPQEWFDALDAVTLDGSLYDRPPIDGAAEALAALHDAGHTIHLVTARGLLNKGHAIKAHTVAWIEANGIAHDSLHFVADKALVRTDVFVDDSPRNTDALGRDAHVADRPALQPRPRAPAAHRARAGVRRADRGARMTDLHRYVVSTPGSTCTGCDARLRVGGNVWHHPSDLDGLSLCDSCAEGHGDAPVASDLQIVSTFAGVGGFDLAGRRAGMRTAVTVEIDKAARGVLVDQFPDAAHLTDIRSVTADDLRSAGVDPRRCVLCAGFPCQDLSVAGRRAGMGQGTRSGLYWELDRLMAEFAPEWVVFENVPGLLSATCPCPGDGACQMDDRGPVRCPGELHAVTGGACVGGCIATHGGTMGAVLGSLGNRGYGFAYRVLDAQHFGVPQRRRRVIIVGRLGDDGTAPAQVLAELEGGLRDSAPSPQAWTRPAGGARGSARGAGGFVDVASTLQAGGGERGYRIDAEAAAGGHVVGFSHSAGLDEQAREEQAPTVMAGHDRMLSVATFRKAGRAQTNQDDETCWTESDVANTVNTFDVGDTRATELVVTPLSVRGRDGGAQVEAGEPGGPAHAVRTPGGGSSHPMVAVTPITTRNATRTGEHDTAGTGIGHEGDPAPSVQTTAPTAVGITGTVSHTLTAEGHDASEDGTGRGTPIVAATLTSGSHAPNVSAPGRRQEDDHNLVVANALTAREGKGPDSDATTTLVHEPTVRRLTPMECERLQGFPDDWTATSNGKPQSDSARYKQMGNSVAVPVIEWTMHGLVAVDRAVRSS